MQNKKTFARARIKKIVRALKPYDPDRVILFGSAARGDVDAHSDIDLVVIKETDARFLDRLGSVYQLIQPNFGLDALVYTPMEFAQLEADQNPLIEEILGEGIVIYERTKGRVEEPLRSTPGVHGMRKSQAEQEGRRWLEQAQSELAAAKWNEQGVFHSVACFWAQQTAERVLKAFLYFRGKRRVFGHSVVELAQKCAHVDADFNSLAQSATLLDRYYLPTRYPNGLPGGVPAQVYRADEAQQTIQLAEKVVTLVAAKIPPAS